MVARAAVQLPHVHVGLQNMLLTSVNSTWKPPCVHAMAAAMAACSAGGIAIGRPQVCYKFGAQRWHCTCMNCALKEQNMHAGYS